MAVINSSYSETFAAATDGARWLKAVVVVGEADDHQERPTKSKAEMGQLQYRDFSCLGRVRTCQYSSRRYCDLAVHLRLNGPPKGAVHLQHDLPSTPRLRKAEAWASRKRYTCRFPSCSLVMPLAPTLLFPFRRWRDCPLPRTLDAGKMFEMIPNTGRRS